MIIVNVSTGHYIRGQVRLAKSLEGHKTLLYTQEPEGSPAHQKSPYEFKIHAIEKALEIDPIVLWVDASMWRVGDLSKIEQIIARDGYFMEEAGAWVDDWCNDHTRKYFNLERGSGYSMFSAGLTGLNLKSETAMEFLYKWKESAKAGCFRGEWSNHRHDMTCASIIASRMGMKYQRGGTHMAYVGPGYGTPKKDVVFYCQGIV